MCEFYLLPSLLRCVEGHRCQVPVADISHSFDGQKLSLVYFTQHQEPALVLGLGETWGLCLAVLLPL